MSIACPSCGTAAPSGARVCPACGTVQSGALLTPAAGSSASAGADPSPRRPSGDRLSGLLRAPDAEWLEIAQAPTSAAQVYWKYGAVLALIGPLSGVAEYLLLGRTSHPPEALAPVIASNVCGYLTVLLSNLVLAYFSAWLAKAFGSPSSLRQAMKVSIYGQTPLFLAGFLNFFPNHSGVALWIMVFWAIVACGSTISLFRKGGMIVVGIARSKALAFAILLFLSLIVLVVLSALPLAAILLLLPGLAR